MEMRILLATDGTPATLGALHLARALAERWSAPVEVVAVMEPFPLYGAGSADLVAQSRRALEHEGEAALRKRVQAQLSELGPAQAAWPVTTEIGAPAPTIVRLASQKAVSLIMLGLGRHALADRWFGTETALRVMRLAHVPVLAVPAESREIPRSAVVGVDFTDFSRDAARTAPEILAPGGALHLAHVLWRPSAEVPWVGGMDWENEYRAGMMPKLQELARALEGATEVRVEPHVLEGDAAHELLGLAERVHAELLAVGSHGTGFFGRILMGSVSTRLVRGARCALLIAPPRSVPPELERIPGTSP